MSLVEQAIARMKNQAGAAKRKVDTAAKPVVPVAIADPPADLAEPRNA